MASTFVPVPNTVAASIHYIQTNQRYQNTLYFNKNTAWTQAQMQALADDLDTKWATQVMIDLSSTLHMTDVTVIDLTSQTSGGAVHTADHSGSDGGNPYTQNDAFCLKLQTALRGRSFRGRIYLPGLTSNMVSSLGILTSTQANNLRDDVQGVIDEIDIGESVQAVVVSRYHGVDVNGKPIPRTTGVVTPITAVTYTDLYIDSQRRRLPGRGI